MESLPLDGMMDSVLANIEVESLLEEVAVDP